MHIIGKKTLIYDKIPTKIKRSKYIIEMCENIDTTTAKLCISYGM